MSQRATDRRKAAVRAAWAAKAGKRADLAAHLAERHRHITVRASWTAGDLAQVHAEAHHRYRTDHHHAGVNTGASERPSGWYTGRDVIERGRS
jgi:hypothetical protein